MDQLSRHRAKRTSTKKRYRKDRRRRVLIAVAIVLLFLLLIVAGVFIGTGGKPSKLFSFLKKDSPQPSYKQPKGRVTLLLIGVEESQVGSVAETLILLTYNPKNNQLDIISIPKNTLTDIPGQDVGEVSRAYSLGRVSLVLATVEFMLGVEIDDYVEMDSDGLKKTIDEFKGIKVAGSNRSGQETLDYIYGTTGGESASDDENSGAKSETEEDQLEIIERQQKVLKGMYEKANKDDLSSTLKSVIEKLKKSFDSSLSLVETTNLALVFAGLKSGNIKYHIIPVQEVTVNNIQYYQPDKAKVNSLIEKIFGADRRKSGDKGSLRLRVLNGTGAPGVANEVARLLIDNGYKVIDIKNADRFDYGETQLIVYSSKSDDMVTANQIKNILGVGKIVINNLPQDVADLTVVIGNDYKRKTYTILKKIEVKNGGISKSRAESIIESLEEAGYEVVDGGSADSSDNPKTQILTQVDNEEVIKMAEDIKDLIGAGEIKASDIPRIDIEISVILGSDL